MSLTRTDTGQAATPLEKLQARNVIRKEETDNALLKEALAISNENCANLMKRQNMLIVDLTEKVNAVRKECENCTDELIGNADKQTREMQRILQDERQFKAEISQTVKSEITRSVSDMKENAKKDVDETTQEIKKELKATAKEIEKQRADMYVEGGFRKFMFWATPILLLVQNIILILLLNKG